MATATAQAHRQGLTRAARGGSAGSLGWGVYTGFIENEYGELTLSGADVLRLALFVCAGFLLGLATTLHDGRRSG